MPGLDRSLINPLKLPKKLSFGRIGPLVLLPQKLIKIFASVYIAMDEWNQPFPRLIAFLIHPIIQSFFQNILVRKKH